MTTLKIFVLLATITLLSTTAIAWNGVQITEADGSLRRHIWGNSTPVPNCCYWDFEDAPNPYFHATNADGDGNMDCADAWLVHCNNDSLVFQGGWPLIDMAGARGSEFLVELSCTVLITDDTRLSAGRAVFSSDLDPNEHAITITYPDGTIVPILAAGSGPDQVQLMLVPGSYQVALHVNVFQNKYPSGVIESYEGRVWLYWEDPGSVSVNSVSWDALKAAYR